MFQYLEINKSSLVSKGIFRKKWSFLPGAGGLILCRIKQCFFNYPKIYNDVSSLNKLKLEAKVFHWT